MSTVTVASETIEPDDYNPLLPHVRGNPYPYYAALRRDAPVHQNPLGLPVFAVSRYADVQFVLHHPELFTSTALSMLAQGGGISIGPNSGALAGHRVFDSPMMIMVDPPDHSRLRRLVNRGFTPRRIAELEPRLRELATDCVAAVADTGRLELVADLAIPFPVTVIAEMLGVEPERRQDFKRWSDLFVMGLSGMSGEINRDDMVRGADEMAEYLERVAGERRRRPADDLISVLVAAEEGDALTDREVLSFVVLLLIAGNETTTNLIGNAVHALLSHPGELEALRSEPSLLPAAIEESLRFDSPIQLIPRQTTRDVELAGTTIPAGAFVMPLFGSANRDERQFDEPERFSVRRRPQGHLAFGHGIHFCLGASLARLEARVALETLLARCAKLELAGPPVTMLDSLVLRGPRALELAFEPVHEPA